MRRSGGVLAVVGLWLVAGLLPLLFGLSDVRLAFGLTGEPGKATVEHCVTYGDQDHQRTRCVGRFVPDAAGAAPRAVRLPPESHQGETFAAVLAGDRAHPSGTKGRLRALALPALGILFLIPLPWGVAFLFFDRSPGRASRYVMGLLAAGAGGVCLAGLFVSNL